MKLPQFSLRRYLFALALFAVSAACIGHTGTLHGCGAMGTYVADLVVASITGCAGVGAIFGSAFLGALAGCSVAIALLYTRGTV